MNSVRILSTGTALPPHQIQQESALQRYRALLPAASPARRALGVFESSGVEFRYLSRHVDEYVEPLGFGARNRRYQQDALELAVLAASRCLENSGVTASAIKTLIFVTTTGLATPSLDAGLASALGLPSDVQRSPLFGLGCAGGVAGIGRATSLLGRDPGSRALLVASETCSHCFDPHDGSSLGAVAASLFGDGAAAVLIGRDTPGSAVSDWRIEAHGSFLIPDTSDVMGWEFEDDGFHLVLSRRLAQVVRREVRPAVDRFLDQNGVSGSDIQHFLLHPGGPKVLEAMKVGLDLDEKQVDLSRQVLREIGNLSSATVLFVLDRFLRAGTLAPGERALMLAPGPGFSLEMVLVAGARGTEDS